MAEIDNRGPLIDAIKADLLEVAAMGETLDGEDGPEAASEAEDAAVSLAEAAQNLAISHARASAIKAAKVARIQELRAMLGR